MHEPYLPGSASPLAIIQHCSHSDYKSIETKSWSLRVYIVKGSLFFISVSVTNASFRSKCIIKNEIKLDIFSYAPQILSVLVSSSTHKL